mmetsp:Transcript_13697/g.27719  ORF Transcript_13697/g.27719 Transcript_13697/m.27719 type:complete len:749 (-) Transcript_13697:6644-8890(-)
MNPLAHSFARRRGVLNDGRRKLLVLDVRADLLDHLLLDVVFVELHQVLDELTRIRQRLLLGYAPVVFDLLAVVVFHVRRLLLKHDAHSLHSQLHRRGWLVVGLQRSDVTFLQGVENLHGCGEEGKGFIEVFLRVIFDGLTLVSLDLGLGCLLLDFAFRNVSGRLFLGNHLGRLLHFLQSLGQDRLFRLQVYLELGNLFLGIGKLVQTVLQLVALGPNLLPLHSEQFLVHGQKLEVGRGSHVVDPPQLLSVLNGLLLHTQVDVLEHVDQLAGVDLLEVQVGLLDLLLPDRRQGLGGPCREPVDRAAVDERREHAQARAELLGTGRHAHAHVDVLLHAKDELRVDIQGCRLDVLVQAIVLALLVDVLHVLLLDQRRHLPGVEDVVHVFEHALLQDLRVGIQEDGGDVLQGFGHEHLLEVLVPLVLVVPLGDLDLVDVVLGHERSQPRETAATRPSHSEQETVASRLANDTADARHVLDGIQEQHQLHRSLALFVVQLEVLLEGFAARLQVGGLLVNPAVTPVRPAEEVATDESLVDHHGVPLLVHLSLHDVAHRVVQPLAILVVDQAIAEDAATLVDPQAHELVQLVGLDAAGLEHALEHLGQITQVEGVVRLLRRGQQVLGDRVVQLDGRVHHLPDIRLDLLAEVSQPLPADGPEDGSLRSVDELGVSDLGEVPKETGSDGLPSASRRSHCANESDVKDLNEGQGSLVSAIVPTAVVHPLSQELDRGLRKVFLPHRHVHVIHEDHEAFS